MKILFLKYDDGSLEEHGEIKNDSDIRYWIDRRIEKAGKTAVGGWIAEQLIDVKSFVEDYQDRSRKYEKEARERQDKLEYERLKKKFEK